MESTYWIRYSEYQTVRDDNGTDWILPAENAVAISYDVAANIGKYVAETVTIALDDRDEMERNLKFVRKFGLLGLALEQDYSMALPEKKADMNQAVFAVTGREGDGYAGVFSPEYREKAANISAWLDWISVQYNRAQKSGNGRLVNEPFAALTLQTMLESACKKMLWERTVKNCPACGGIFYHEDPNRETCGEKCQILYDNMKHFKWLKENFHSRPISGG